MTKRFTDSEKFRDKWYRSLKPKHKCLWEYLISECSLAGIIDFDYESASFHIGEKITEEDIKIFSDRIYILPDGKFFIPKFIIFQQGTLNQNNNAHKSILKELKKYGISETLENIEFRTPCQGGLEGVHTPISNSKGKGNSKSNSNNKEIEINFEEFYCLYPRKEAKREAFKAYSKAIKLIDKDTIIKGLKEYIKHIESDKIEKKYIKHPATWLNQGCWEDEYQKKERGSNGWTLV